MFDVRPHRHCALSPVVVFSQHTIKLIPIIPHSVTPCLCCSCCSCSVACCRCKQSHYCYFIISLAHYVYIYTFSLKHIKLVIRQACAHAPTKHRKRPAASASATTAAADNMHPTDRYWCAGLFHTDTATAITSLEHTNTHVRLVVFTRAWCGSRLESNNQLSCAHNATTEIQKKNSPIGVDSIVANTS